MAAIPMLQHWQMSDSDFTKKEHQKKHKKTVKPFNTDLQPIHLFIPWMTLQNGQLAAQSN